MDKETHYVFLFGYNDINSAKESEQFPRIFFSKNIVVSGFFFIFASGVGRTLSSRRSVMLPTCEMKT
jgi:hypothetical protein